MAGIVRLLCAVPACQLHNPQIKNNSIMDNSILRKNFDFV